MSAMLKQKLIDIANGFTKYGLWKGGISSALSEMTDVSFTDLQANDVLKYNGSKWVNDDSIQNQINTLNNNFSDIGSHASSRISVAENITIGTSSKIITMGTPISNTNTNIFTEADGGGILIKKRGIYLVRCRLHIMQSANDIIKVAIQRYLANETDGVYPIQSYTPNPDYAVQLTVDFLSVIYHDSDITDRFVIGVWSDNGNSYVYGTNIASDSMISVTKIG